MINLSCSEVQYAPENPITQAKDKTGCLKYKTSQ